MKRIFLLNLLLSIIVVGCYNEDDYLPTNKNEEEILISLSASAKEMPADGQSYVFISAELPVDAIDAKSVVVFSTTKGTFDNNSKTITQNASLVKIDGQDKRIAKVKLNSSSLIETAEVTATVSNVSRAINISFTNLDYDNMLKLTSPSISIPADGASSATVEVEQPLNIHPDYTNITFSTTAGSFDNGTKTITKASSVVLVGGVYKRIAQIRLLASKIEEKANIEISIKGTSKKTEASFYKAFPESISINISAPVISSGYNNSISITTNLSRTVGVPSLNNEISLSVVDENLIARGSFVNYVNKTDINGAVINKFTLGNDKYVGVLKIIATCTDANGNKIYQETQLIAQ